MGGSMAILNSESIGIRNCVYKDNYAVYGGGALHVEESSDI